jgi:hypothetical protein
VLTATKLGVQLSEIHSLRESCIGIIVQRTRCFLLLLLAVCGGRDEFEGEEAVDIKRKTEDEEGDDED